MRDSLVLQFHDVLEVFHLLRTRCFKRRLHRLWKGAVYNFKEVVIPFLSKNANAGNTYVHLVCCHLEDIFLKNEPHGLASIAHDQAIEHSHSICRQIATDLRLPNLQERQSIHPSDPIMDDWKRKRCSIVTPFNARCLSFKHFQDAKNDTTVTDEQLKSLFTVNLEF